MTYTETQLEAIKILGKKDLSFGCIYYPNTDDFAEPYFYVEEWVWVQVKSWWLIHDSSYEIEVMNSLDVSILWHIPHLEDLFRVAGEKWKRITIEYYTQWPHLIFNPIEVNLRNPDRIPYNPTLPLLDQPNLSDILNLFK